MEATMTTKRTGTYRNYWQMIGGERFYTLARWVIVILVFAISLTTITTPVWPISLQSDPIVFVLWAYIAYTLCMSVALFIPPLESVIKQAYVGDIIFIVLLSLFNGSTADIFLPFYFLPLISAAIRLKPMSSLIMGAVTALFYILALFIGIGGGAAFFNISIGLQALIIVFIPWLTSSLVEQWSANNRRDIANIDQRRILAEQQTQDYRERMHAFSHIAATLANSMEPKQVLTATMQEIQKLVPYSTGMVMFSTGRPKELKIEALEPANPGDLGRTFSVAEGTIGTMLRPSSLPRILDAVSDEEELASIAALRSCASACILPLRLKVTTFGILLIASDQPKAYTQEHLDMLSGITSYLIFSLHSVQMAADLRQLQSKVISKEKEIRDRMASKLHDGPTQKVAQIMMQADFVKQALKKDPAMVPQELDKFAELAKVANAEMRMTLFELRPLTLESDGLRTALNEYVEKLKLRAGKTQVLVKSKGAVDSVLTKEAEGVIFDIIQESVNNALKHAQATHIWITLERKGTVYTASIQDDGKGFDISSARESATKRASFGLKNFSERAQMIGGNVELDSEPGQGTTVRIVLSIEKS